MVKKNVISLLVVAAMAILMFASFPAYAVDIGYMDEHGAEGEELFEAFKEAYKSALDLKSGNTQSIDNRINDLTEIRHASYYELITGKSQDEYISLSNYDKVILASTFIEPYYKSDLGQTYNNDTEWSYATDTFMGFFEKYFRDDDIVKDKLKLSYKNLMYWQYQYYQSSGSFYNFVEGMDTLDYINEKYIDDMKSSDTSSSETATESEENVSYVESYVESQVSEISSENVSHADHVSSFVQANNKSSKAPYIIIGVLVVVIGVMAAMLLKKNKGNTEQK